MKAHLNLYANSLEADGVLEAFLGSKFCCLHLRYLACSFKSLAIAEPIPEFNVSNFSASFFSRLFLFLINNIFN